MPQSHYKAVKYEDFEFDENDGLLKIILNVKNIHECKQHTRYGFRTLAAVLLVVMISALLVTPINASVSDKEGTPTGYSHKIIDVKSFTLQAAEAALEPTGKPTKSPTPMPITAQTSKPTPDPSILPTFTPSKTPTAPPSSTPVSSNQIDYSLLHKNSWRTNLNSNYNSYFSSYTDILYSAYDSTTKTWKVTFNGIVDYTRNFSTSDINALNSRPKKSTDFNSGVTTAVAGKSYVWGADIGYKITGSGCSLKYWPPGPVCPISTSTTFYSTISPAPETGSTGCSLPSLGKAGYMVNGAAIFGFRDGFSYNNGGTWTNLAPEMEQYDMDVCNGHAAMGTYHHHHYPKCLGEKLGDTGSLSHSLIWGWALDGYPIYGPYQGVNTLAVSCWKKRDYSVSSGSPGCATTGRTCTLVDQYDYTKGTTVLAAAKYGPSITGTVTTLSGNTVSAASGIYFEDYYFDSTCYAQGGAYLDSHNGHSHGTYGYHYHITIDSSATATFPYIHGPKYYGCITDRSVCSTSSCSTTTSASAASEYFKIGIECSLVYVFIVLYLIL